MSENIDKLIKDHTPILWLHPHESYLPEDCEVMAKSGDLYKKGKNPRLLKKFKKTLADLANYDSQYFLKLPEIDMREFKVSPKHGIPGSGPDAVAELAKRKYAYNPFQLILLDKRYENIMCVLDTFPSPLMWVRQRKKWAKNK